MRVNVYAEELTDRIEIISKEIDGQVFMGLRFYLELPVTVSKQIHPNGEVAGPFIHHPGDDDSAAVTFWGKQDLREVLRKALEMLDKHYSPSTPLAIDIEIPPTTDCPCGHPHIVHASAGCMVPKGDGYCPCLNARKEATSWTDWDADLAESLRMPADPVSEPMRFIDDEVPF
jgi:hypothetical protein